MKALFLNRAAIQAVNGDLAMAIDELVSANNVQPLEVGEAKIRSGIGSPEGRVTGNPGDLYLRTDGEAANVGYVKTHGKNTATGWSVLAEAASGAIPALHHTTHEPGGNDALTALSADILTSGTVADVRLTANVLKYTGGYPGGTANFLRADGTFAAPSSGVAAHHATHEPGGTDALVNAAWVNQANTFTADQTLSRTNPTIDLIDTSQSANLRAFRVVNYAQLMQVQSINDALTTAVVVCAFNRAGDVTAYRDLFAARDIYEKGRGIPMGHVVDVPFNAASYTVYPSGTWSVVATDVVAFSYTLVGKTVTLTLNISGSTISGAPVYLIITNPVGAPSRPAAGIIRITQPSGVVEEGTVWIQTADGSIYLARKANATWATFNNISLTFSYFIP